VIDGFAQVLGVVEGGPSPGLLLPRIPAHYTSLGGPPSFQSITRYAIFLHMWEMLVRGVESVRCGFSSLANRMPVLSLTSCVSYRYAFDISGVSAALAIVIVSLTLQRHVPARHDF
jgi:hypothetical protein